MFSKHDIRVVVQEFVAAFAALTERHLHKILDAAPSARRLTPSRSAERPASLENSTEVTVPTTTASPKRTRGKRVPAEAPASLENSTAAAAPSKTSSRRTASPKRTRAKRVAADAPASLENSTEATAPTKTSSRSTASPKRTGAKRVAADAPASLQNSTEATTPTKTSAVLVANDLATRVLNLLRDNEATSGVRITDRTIAETFRAPRAAVSSTMRLLIDTRQVVTIGSGRAAHYRIAGAAAIEPEVAVALPASKSRSKGASMSAIEKLVEEGLQRRMDASTETTS